MHESPTKIHAVILIFNLKSHINSVFQSSSGFGFLWISHSAILEFTEFSDHTGVLLNPIIYCLYNENDLYSNLHFQTCLIS